MPFTEDDYRYMSRALRLARHGLYTTHPNPRVGCVIVADGDLVGEGWHQVAGGPHAEIVALGAAGERSRGATVYVSLEPCNHVGRTGPCAQALLEAGVGRVVAAMKDPNPAVAGAGLARLAAAGVRVDSGLMGAEAADLNAGFVRRMTTGSPRVTVKIAASLDGRTAMASGESRWVTGEAAREDVQRWRAASSAILTGIGTVLADDPSLNVRSPACDMRGRIPLRVVLDPGLRMPASSRMLRLPGETLVVCREGPDASALEAAGASIMRCAGNGNRIDLEKMLRALGERGCNDVLVEAGPTLCGALVAAGLADDLLVYLAPHVMGDAARGMFGLPGLERMADRVQLQILDTRKVGEDLRIHARFRQVSS